MSQRVFVQRGMLPVYHSACDGIMLFGFLVAERGKHESEVKETGWVRGTERLGVEALRVVRESMFKVHESENGKKFPMNMHNGKPIDLVTDMILCQKWV